MQKMVIGLIITFFMYCLPYELNYQPIPVISLSPDIFSNQAPSFQPIFYCDSYKHRNNFFLSSQVNLYEYTADQLQRYFHKNNYSEKYILDQEVLYLSDEFVKLAKTYAGYTQAIERLYKKLSKFGPGKKILFFKNKK